MRKFADCWSKDTTPEIASLADIWRNKHEFARPNIAHDRPFGPDVEPVPPAGSGSAGRPLSLVSSAAQRGPGALGSLFAHLDSDSLCGCGDGTSAFFCQPHAHTRAADGTRLVDTGSARGGVGASDVVPGSTCPWPNTGSGIESFHAQPGGDPALAHPGHHE